MTALAHNILPESSPLYFRVVERKLYWQSDKSFNGRMMHVIEDEKALVRANNGSPVWLANVGKDYKVVQNRELFEYIGSVIVKTLSLDQLHGAYIHDEQSFGGRHCYRTYTFPSLKAEVGGHEINFRIYVANGFGGSAVQFLSGAYELVCTNGMVIGFADRTVRKHTSGLSIPDLGKWVEQGVEAFVRSRKVWGRWVRTAVTDERVQAFFEQEQSISRRLGERLFERWQTESIERGNNVWALYNALTHYATHNMVSPLRDTGNDHAAKTIMDRHRQVNRWVNGSAWCEHIGIGMSEKVDG